MRITEFFSKSRWYLNCSADNGGVKHLSRESAAFRETHTTDGQRHNVCFEFVELTAVCVVLEGEDANAERR